MLTSIWNDVKFAGRPHYPRSWLSIQVLHHQASLLSVYPYIVYRNNVQERWSGIFSGMFILSLDQVTLLLSKTILLVHIKGKTSFFFYCIAE